MGSANSIVVDNYGKRYEAETKVTDNPSRYFFYKAAVHFDITTLTYPRTPSWMIFDAMPLVAGGPNTKGGLLADADRRVLTWEGKPIPHLYCVGEIASALKFVYQGGGNLTECLVYGRNTGKIVAKLLNSKL